MPINNDSEFKAALAGMTGVNQRRLAAHFTKNVLELCQDHRVKRAIDTALLADPADDEFNAALQLARAAHVDSYTRCGHECNWNSQAGHFVAEAVLDCFKPVEPGGNLAWDAAMHARMARTCQAVANGFGSDNSEAVTQYRIFAEFLSA
jgi:hypothetical protein